MTFSPGLHAVDPKRVLPEALQRHLRMLAAARWGSASAVPKYYWACRLGYPAADATTWGWGGFSRVLGGRQATIWSDSGDYLYGSSMTQSIRQQLFPDDDWPPDTALYTVVAQLCSATQRTTYGNRM